MFRFSAISNVVGVMLIILGVMMLTVIPFSLIYSHTSDIVPIIKAAATTIIFGGLMWMWRFRTKENIGKREGYLIVAFGWISMSIACTLPYLYSGSIPNLTDAFFESASGLTTTGASILNDIESLPEDILYWRSLTQWIGGMGIIVLTVAIFPLLGIGGVELFVAEAPGPTSDKIHPRISEVAKRLWLIYIGLTALLLIILRLAGMDIFDAINHALTTMATGGFSTKNASMAHYDSALIQYPIIFFMFLAGTNYTLIYFGLNGKFKKVWASNEFRMYIIVIMATVLVFAASVFLSTDTSFEKAFRDSLFQVISLVTTTGFVSADYTLWGTGVVAICFLLLFMGGCAGSTSGGIKMIRHLTFFKHSISEFKRILHPKAMVRIKIDKQVVTPRILSHILVFLLIYLITFAIGVVVMAFILQGTDQPLLTALGATATSLGNVGPGIGAVGPVNNFANIPNAGKWFLSFLMIVGRLELYTILILFSPGFWRPN